MVDGVFYDLGSTTLITTQRCLPIARHRDILRMFRILPERCPWRLGSVRTALGVIPDACARRREISGNMPLP